MVGEQEREREQERESGWPGGGVGRREDVSGSGVYPASGPGAPAGAEPRTPGEWGRGGRPEREEEAARAKPGGERRGGEGVGGAEMEREEASGAQVDEEDLVDRA